MRLDDTIDKATYESKYCDLTSKLSQLNDERTGLQDTAGREINVKKRICDFRKVLEQNEVLTELDRYVFESIVEKVIVGGTDNDGNKDPALLTFVYKTGFTNCIDGNSHKPERKNTKRKNAPNELCSYTPNEVGYLCSYKSDYTYGLLSTENMLYVASSAISISYSKLPKRTTAPPLFSLDYVLFYSCKDQKTTE